MKKIFSKPIDNIAVILALLLFSVGVLFLVYKTWMIFGFWNMIWTGLLTSVSGAAIQLLFSARRVKNSTVIFNPREAPRFLHVALCLGVAYYLYTLIAKPEVSPDDYIFGLVYLLALTCLPAGISIFRLLRDSRDFVSIDAELLWYRDNKTRNEFAVADITGVEMEGRKGLILHLKDGSKHAIPLARMNFSARDMQLLHTEMKQRFPAAGEEAAPTETSDNEK